MIDLLSGNEAIKTLFKGIANSRLAISIVSRMEVLVGTEKQNLNLQDAEMFLDLFENIVLDKAVVKEATNLVARLKNNLKFKDLAIAATATLTKLTLITADKDFMKIPGLKVKLVKV